MPKIPQGAFSYTVKTADVWLLLRLAVGAARNDLRGVMGLWHRVVFATCTSLLALDSRGDSNDDLSRESWGRGVWRATLALET